MVSPATRLDWMRMFERTGSAKAVCEAFAISRPTLRKWWRRYRAQGVAGLEDGSRRPASSPNQKVFAAEEALILALRRDRHLGLHRLRAELRRAHGLSISADTILKVLHRAGEPLMKRARPAPPTAPVPPDDAAAAIAALITAGLVRPGEKLSEAALSARLGIGRTKVREALKQLAVTGLVELLHNRGAFVTSPSLEEVEQAYAARRLIEGAIVADLAQHCTANDIRTLRRHLDAQKQAQTSGSRADLVRLLTEFHRVIAGLGGNVVLARLLDGLAAQTSLAVLIYDHGGAPSCAVAEHERLIDMLAAGDAAAAVALMGRHLTTNQLRLVRG